MRAAPLVAAALAVGSLAACSGGGGAHDAADGSTTAAAPASTTVHYTGDARSAFCTMLGQLDDGRVAQDQTEDAAAVQAGMTRYRTQLADLDAAAPAAIEPDVRLLATGIADLDDALHSVDYSWDQLSSAADAADVAAQLNDPAYAAAGAHLTAYKTQVCHL